MRAQHRASHFLEKLVISWPIRLKKFVTTDLTADQAMAAPKESGTYDRDAVQELLHQYGIAFTGQTIPDSCLQICKMKLVFFILIIIIKVDAKHAG